MPIKPRYPIEPRGISLSQAAAYIGVSTSFFTTLVREGRMPEAKQVGSRRIWDRWKVDTAFENLGEDHANEWDIAIRQAAATQQPAQPEHDDRVREMRLKMDLEWYGRSTEGLSEAEIEILEQERKARWVKAVQASRLNKRERVALHRLYELRDRFVKRGEIRDAGWTTQDRLEARGFVTITSEGDRFMGWQITPEGVAALKAGVADQ